MSVPTLTILGSGPGTPQPDRACSGYAVTFETEIHLMDCGSGVVASFVRFGLDPRALRCVYLSHMHPDHWSDLIYLIQYLYIIRRPEPLAVFVPVEALELIGRLLDASYLFGDKLSFRLDLVGYEPGPLVARPLVLTAIANEHLGHNGGFIEPAGLPNRMQCCSFSLSIPGCRVFYSSDVESVDEVIPHALAHDLTLVEAAHIDIEPLIEAVTGCPERRVVVTHVGTAQELDRIRGLVMKLGCDHVTTALDGMTIALRAHT